MNLIKKKVPGRLSRAILTLAARTGNKLMRVGAKAQAAGESRAKKYDPACDQDQGLPRFSEHTTITVETEHLLIVREKRFSRER